MRILWLATDRSDRVADLFGPLQRSVADIADVDFIYRKLNCLPKQWQNNFTKGTRKPERLVNIKKANEYDFIMVDAPFAFLDEAWGKIKTPKGVLIEDQHGDVLEYSKIYKKHKFDVFFTRYKNILNQHKWLKDENIKWLPHSIDPNIFNDYHLNKKFDCLMVGRIQRNVYPIRWKVNQSLRNGGVNYYQINRPEEVSEKHLRWPVGKDYARLINQSLMTFTCMSMFQYPVSKIFEIPACDSVLVSDYNEELFDLGFEPNINMIDITHVKNIKSFVKKLLKDRNRLYDISFKGHELIHERHTARYRAEEFLEYLEEIC